MVQLCVSEPFPVLCVSFPFVKTRAKASAAVPLDGNGKQPTRLRLDP